MPRPGPDKALCGAQRPNQPKGVTCKNVAGHGTGHVGTGRCARHGGATPNHVKAGQVAKAKQACAVLGIGTGGTIDPAEALLGEVVRTCNAIAYYEAQIEQLPADEQGAFRVYGRTFHASGEATGEAKPHVLVQLWIAERKHLADVTAKALHAGVARRAIELAEDTARQVVGVLSEFARRLGLDPSSPEVREAGREALQLVAGGQG